MCGRFVQYSDPDLYASQLELDALCQTRPRYNLAPTQPVLAIRETDAGKRELVALRWGLVPAWSKGPDSRYSMINARAETVKSKPATATPSNTGAASSQRRGFTSGKRSLAGRPRS
jgi:putative SOS response-associated peptidase YedK